MDRNQRGILHVTTSDGKSNRKRIGGFLGFIVLDRLGSHLRCACDHSQRQHHSWVLVADPAALQLLLRHRCSLGRLDTVVGRAPVQTAKEQIRQYPLYPHSFDWSLLRSPRGRVCGGVEQGRYPSVIEWDRDSWVVQSLQSHSVLHNPAPGNRGGMRVQRCLYRFPGVCFPARSRREGEVPDCRSWGPNPISSRWLQ